MLTATAAPWLEKCNTFKLVDDRTLFPRPQLPAKSIKKNTFEREGRKALAIAG